ncbi:MAG: peptidyl-prolyl cis-trans isomerase [Myxococcota bacterium]|nr:peptidyl-prolyl cis-trans isomerase [Myxococcota bacterium]
MLNLSLFAFLFACQEQAKETIPGELPETGETFAIVNGKKLTEGTVDSILSRIPEAKQEEIRKSGAVDQFKDQLITTEVLYQQAIAAGLHQKEEHKIAMSMAQREVLATALVQVKVEERVTDEMLKKSYDEKLVSYRKSEADLSMLMVADEAKANEVKAMIDAGADFVAMVKEHSEDPKAKENGGAMGKVNTKQLPPMLSGPISKAKKGDVVGPVNLMGKFALLKVNDLVESITPFEDVKESLKEEVLRSESKKFVDEARKAADVTDLSKEKAEVKVEEAGAEKKTEEKKADDKKADDKKKDSHDGHNH